MMPLADVFVHVYVLVDDALQRGAVAVPPRPGPAPSCSDAEVLTVALVRHLLARRSERDFLAEGRRDWRHSFPALPALPALPAQSECTRRVRWLWGAFEALRQRVAAAAPEDAWQQADTTALPVEHPSRVRGPDGWDGPGGLRAGFGFDAAHREWFSGFRLAVRTDLGTRLVRACAWGMVPAAVDERAVADALRDGGPPPDGLLLDRGFLGQRGAADQRPRGTRVVYAHTRTGALSARPCLPPCGGPSPRCAPAGRPPAAS